MLLISWEDAFPFSYVYVCTYMYVRIFSLTKLHKVHVAIKEVCTGIISMLQLLFGILPSALRHCNLQSCRSDFQFYVYVLLKSVIDRQPTQWCQVLLSSKSPEYQQLRNKWLLTLGAHAQRRLQYLVCVSTTIIALQAMRRLMSDTNSFNATRARKMMWRFC